MRYEAMRLLQFLFSLTLIVGAFAAGVLAGWYRWAPRRGRPDEDHSGEEDTPPIDASAPTGGGGGGASDVGRSPLFSPEGQGWGVRRSPASRTRSVVLSSDPGPRRSAYRARGELPRGARDDEVVIDLRDTTVAGEHPTSRPPDF